ncbi:spore coat protein [Paenibacillaceae bacterium WGS1546]|uniref:spore coat protein n=1 Tax=Cohnella sp. WGS1546 TaxID=3366810 RepID=UPI00372D1696
MELHESVVFQANHLMGFKMNLPRVKDPVLHKLYAEAIHSLEKNLKELVPYYKMAPMPSVRALSDEDLTAFYAGHLLLFAKTAVRNLAVGITEVATPALRETFRKQLNDAIQLHAKVFAFMLERGLYPAYDLNRLLANDQKIAAKALNL